MSGLTLDAGGLIALDKDDRRVVTLLARAAERGMRITVPATALAQAMRNPARQARLCRLIRQASTDLVELDGPGATATGLLLAKSGTADIVDAHVVLESLEELGRLKPTGQGNPGVQCFARNLSHQRGLQRIGADRQHVKMWVTDGVTTHEAVWWGAGAESLPVGRFDLAFAPQVNEYNGRRSVQLKVLDWRPG